MSSSGRTGESEGPTSEVNGGAFRFVASYAVALACIQALALGLSAFEAPIGSGLAQLIMFAGAASGLAYWFVLRHSAPRQPLEAPPANDADETARKWTILVGAAACLVYFGMWWVAWLKPDLSWDGNTAHIPTIHFWMQRGYVYWIEPGALEWDQYVSTAWNGTPKGVHVVACVFVQAFGVERLLNGLNLPLVPMGAAAVYCLARRLGARQPMAALASLFYPLIPLHITQGGTTYVDSATASCFGAFLAVIAPVYAALERGRIPWRLLPALGATAGLALGAKTTGIVLVPLGMTLVAYRALHTWYASTAHQEHRIAPVFALVSLRRSFLMQSAAFILATGLCALAAGGFWSIRNYVYTGSPLHPVGLAFDGITIFPGPSLNEMAVGRDDVGVEESHWSHSRRVLHSWLQGARRWPASIRWHDSRDGGLGFIWLVGCAPALLLLVYASVRAPVRAWRWQLRQATMPGVLVAVVVLTALTFFIRPWNQVPRHTLWLLGLGLPCWAVLVQFLGDTVQTPLGKRLARAWLVVCIGVVLAEAMYAFAWTATRRHSGDPNAISLAGVRPLSTREWVEAFWPDTFGTLYERVVMSSDPVALGPLGHRKMVILGQLSQPMGRRTIRFIPEASAMNPEYLDAFLARNPVRFVVLDGVTPLSGALAARAVRYELAPGMPSHGYHIYELAPERWAGEEETGEVPPSGPVVGLSLPAG